MDAALQQILDRALQHHQAGDLPQAERLYRQILASSPRHAVATHLLGVLAHQAGQHQQAIDLIRRALTLDPNYAEAWGNLGLVLGHTGQRQAAIDAYRRAITSKPDYPEAHYNLGVDLAAGGQLDDAIAAYRQAIAHRPDYADAYFNLAAALKDKDAMDESIAAYRQAIALRPNWAEALNNLADVLRRRGELAAATEMYARASALRPDLSQIQDNLASALLESGRVDDAIAAARRAVALKPDNASSHSNLGNALFDAGEFAAAEAAYRRAIALEPNVSRWHSNLLLLLHYLPDRDAQSIFDEHLRWQQACAAPLSESIQPHENDRTPDRPLRIGYVSPDFRDHVASRFISPLLANHDRRSFHVVCYAAVDRPDDVTRQLQSHADQWRDISKLSDEQAAALIRRERIDILVDLAMHSGGNRLEVFARKPAPVQATYLAYCGGTTGLATVDYRITDPHVDPPHIQPRFYTEKLIRLPDTYWCYAAPAAAGPVAPLPAATAGHVTFGCLNVFRKMNQPLFALWCEILRALPDSRLVLQVPAGAHRRKLLEFFAERSVAAERITFHARVPIDAYFRLYNSIDIALDTFPFTGGTTTCDALWMGVPVVSLCGERAISRGGLSILSNTGLSQLVAHSPQQYVQIATEMSRDLPALGFLRQQLRMQMRNSPLMDAKRFVATLEAAYRQMWQQYCSTKQVGDVTK